MAMISVVFCFDEMATLIQVLLSNYPLSSLDHIAIVMNLYIVCIVVNCKNRHHEVMTFSKKVR